jgi:hypothetical protein
MIKRSIALVGPPLMILAMATGIPAHAAVTSPSPGCTQMNSATYDANYTSGPALYQQFGYSFAAGERLIVSASTPSSGTSVVTALTVVGSVTTSITSGVPGVMSYTLTEDLDSTGEGVSWGITGGTGGTLNATWAVECIAYSAPAPGYSTPASGPRDQMQQFALLPGATCFDVDVPVRDWGQDIIGGWSASWAEWPHNGTGGPVCTRTLSYSNGEWHAR